MMKASGKFSNTGPVSACPSLQKAKSWSTINESKHQIATNDFNSMDQRQPGITSDVTDSKKLDLEPSPSPQSSPQSFLLALFGNSSIRPSLEITNFFIEYTEEQIEAYDMDVIRAVRSQDIPQLRTIHQAGKHLQCANRFGESLIHMACRRGFVDVVRFLIEEAGVSVRVRDDYGRTVLHDACWTSEPNEDLVEMLIRRCPELLLMSDKRGYAPFEYVRNEHWGRWVEFLSRNKDILRSDCVRAIVG